MFIHIWIIPILLGSFNIFSILFTVIGNPSLTISTSILPCETDFFAARAFDNQEQRLTFRTHSYNRKLFWIFTFWALFCSSNLAFMSLVASWITFRYSESF